MTGALCRMNVSDPQGVLTYKMGRDFPTFTKQGPGTHDLVKITRKSEESAEESSQVGLQAMA